MKDSQEHLVKIAHIPAWNAPYCIGWVRQVYEHADRPLGRPMSPEVEQQALARLMQHCEDWQMRQAHHALRLYRYLLSSQQAEQEPRSVEGNPAAWHDLTEKVRRVMRLQHKSLQTEKSYLGWLRRFEAFTKAKPFPEVSLWLGCKASPFRSAGATESSTKSCSLHDTDF